MNFYKFLQIFIIFLIIFAWIFSGWQATSLRAEEATSTLPDSAATSMSADLTATSTIADLIATSTSETATSTTAVTPVVTSTPATTSTAEVATSVTSTTSATSTPTDNFTSTQEVSSQSSTENLSSQTEAPSEEELVEESVPQPEPQPEPTTPSPLLKERKFTKEVRIDAGARHFCVAKNFNVNLSGKNEAMVELEFTGMRSNYENLEIGSLPLGIDITFLNNADYSWSPLKSDDGAVLQIVNQPGSQKGNFSIPIIYQSGNSTTICQINIINF